jgi:hypothetical protein
MCGRPPWAALTCRPGMSILHVEPELRPRSIET